MRHTFIHEDLAKMMKGFRYDAHPMGMVISTMASMSTLHPEANPALAGQDVRCHVFFSYTIKCALVSSGTDSVNVIELHTCTA